MRHLRNAAWIAGAVALVAADSWLALRGKSFNDYTTEARPAVDALVGWHLHRFLELAPAYAGSLVLRGPFVLLAHALGADQAWLYRASAIPCLVAAAIVGLWLARRVRSRGASTLVQVLTLAICAACPLIVQALEWGHPEDLLGGALCVGAVLTAIDDRPCWSGLLLGLAVANKEWAVLAAGPVLVALPRRRVLAACLAAVSAAALLAPFALVGAAGGGSALTSTGSIFQRWDVWWFLGTPRHIPGVHGPLYVSDRTGPAWLAGVAHPLIVVLGLALSALYEWLCRRRREPRRAADALLLLAFLLLARCVLDPWDFVYYPVPLVLALAAWEAVRFRRAPLWAMGASVAAWFTMLETAMPVLGISQDVQSLMFLAVALAGLVAIAGALYRPRRAATMLVGSRAIGAAAT